MQPKSTGLNSIKKETEDARKALSDQKFGNEIERLRLEAGLSQDELGKLTGDRQSVIHRIEKAKYGVTLDLVFRLAVALRDDPHRLASIYWDSYSDKYSDENKRVLDSIWDVISTHYLRQPQQPPATVTDPTKPRFPFTPDKQAKDIVAEMNQKIKDANPKPDPLPAEELEDQEKN